MKASGIVKVVDSKGASLMNQKVDKGDVFRMCQVKDAPIRKFIRASYIHHDKCYLHGLNSVN